MNLKDRFMEALLTAFDWWMDIVTFRQWTQVRGDVTWQSKIKIKESNHE